MSVATLEEIEICTRQVWFWPPSHVAKLIIARKENRFLREWFLNGQTDELPADRVAQLLAALSRPAVPQLDPALFDLPESVLRKHYSSIWTNDSPAHLVRITFSTGRVITIRTGAQQAFMLPLKVSDSMTRMDWETFDPCLSQALAALMPDGYLEKERLAGHLGELERHLQEHTRRGDQPADLPEMTQTAADVSDSATNFEEMMQQVRDKMYRVFSGEESPEEKAEAERAGMLSERLLKRISLADVRDLLARGANPSIADSVGQTALIHAARPPLDRDRFRLLVQAGADLEARRNDGCTGLHSACAGGELGATQEWVQAGADIQAHTPEGATPLMLAASWCDIVRLLLAAGAEVNASDQDGHTALAYAILKQAGFQAERQLAAMRALLDAGADVNCRDREGITPLGHAHRVLAREHLGEEISRAFHPDADLSLGREWDNRRMAEVVMNLIASAGGRE